MSRRPRPKACHYTDYANTEITVEYVRPWPEVFEQEPSPREPLLVLPDGTELHDHPPRIGFRPLDHD
jgi:hypothetical protein